MKLLLIEDDPGIGEGLHMGLNAQGIKTHWQTTGQQGWQALQREHFDVVILDLGLPDMDGLELLHRIRALPSHPPVLIASARSQAADRVKGLHLGADDYLSKPFDFDELVARLHTLHRRQVGRKQPHIQVGHLTLDPLRRTAQLNAQPLTLTAREFDLLQALCEPPGAVRSLDWLERRLCSWDERTSPNALQVHLHHLKRKLGEGSIENIRGVGYRLALSDAEST